MFAAWSPTIGDPTAMGWITVALYFGVSLLAALVSSRHPGRLRLFWLILSAILLALAINKQLDLQSALTATGRCLAKAQGWYDARQIIQSRFILAIMGLSVVAALWLCWAMRRDLGRIWLAVIGFVCLLAFIAIRASGFHHFDQFIGYEIGNVRMNWILEIGGIALIGLNALYLLRRKAGRRARRR